MTAPFVIRMYYSADGGLLPKSLKRAYDTSPNFAKWAKAVMERESVTSSFDANKYNESFKARLAKQKQAAT